MNSEIIQEDWDDDEVFLQEELIPANFGLRLAAALIDGLIMTVVIYIIIILFVGLLFGSMSFNGSEEPSMGLIIMGVFMYFIGLPFAAFSYQAYFESGKHQATPGKMAVRIKVVDMDGDPISFWRAFGRAAAKLLSAMIFYIGFLMMLWTDKSQCLHDMIASTQVVEAER